MSGLDVHLFQVINGDLSNAVFDLLMPFITRPGPFIIPLTLIGVGLVVWGGRKGRILVVMALLLLGVTNEVSEQLKLLFQRPRPCLALETVRLLVGCSKGNFSFPSSHASNITAQALLFASSYRPIAVPLFLVAAAVGYSRVYVGVHYPVDVVGGVLVGLACGAVFIFLTREVERRLPKRQPTTDEQRPTADDRQPTTDN
ncbi:MAG: phosphatase PAP2 family protein [Candidatus Methylomirabilales bacterium]